MCGDDGLRHTAAAALPHINLLLAVYSGAALAMSARLKWDPSAYVLLRELLPMEYNAAAVALPTLALLLLLLGHLAHAATPPSRRLLYSYAALMVALVVAEVTIAVLAWRRVHEWLRSPSAVAAAEMQRELGEHLLPLLRALSRLYPLPTKLTDLIEEAKADLPRNGYVAGGAAVLLLLLQIAGAMAALLLASPGSYKTARASLTHATRNSLTGRGVSADPRSHRGYTYDSVASAPSVPRTSSHSS
ncbi:uncharacterized protein LOC113229464 [Hyposmocoma kahamanoa]|uniref:uncharacterized protein LOC113229464 n=1 Tax=Hyposmocoma kahamanoa TaxID=1477025 RepID=UPI000E6D960B|nr:uncharacterized protein LOC113229464 [Hyposmocoma kahamanoa]